MPKSDFGFDENSLMVSKIPHKFCSKSVSPPLTVLSQDGRHLPRTYISDLHLLVVFRQRLNEMANLNYDYI